VKRVITTLLLVTLIQCALVATVYWPQQIDTSQSVRPVWETLTAAAIDEIRIVDEQGQEQLLQKNGEHWQLPGQHTLPVDPERIEKLLQGLLSHRGGWPVAHSPAARQRFQVANYHFQRHISLFGEGERLGDIYLGTSPGFRKVHARSGGQGGIYAISFNVFDAPLGADAWLDPRLLQVRTPMRISADAYSIHRDGGQWQSGSGGTPEERELLSLLAALRSLQIKGVASAMQEQQLKSTEATLVLDIDSLAGTVQLQLYRLGRYYFIRSSEYPLIFALSAWDYDRLTTVDILRISGKYAGE